MQRVNPASTALTNNEVIDFAYRNQKTGGDFSINSAFLSVTRPFFSKSTGKPWGGMGVALLSDKSSYLFKTQEASASFSVNIPLATYQTLSMGFKGLMRWQNINLDGLYTGSQFVDGHGFVGASDEPLKPFNNRYFTMSAGMLWQQTDKKGKVLKQLGFSFFDFNKPNPTFLDGSQDELPSTFIAHGSWQVYKKNKLGIVPEFLITTSASKSMILVGGKFQYDINKNDRADVLLKYAYGRSAIVGFQLHREKYSVGLSYDFPAGNRNVANLGAFELGIELRNPVDPKNRRNYTKKKSKKSWWAKKKKKKQGGGTAIAKAPPARKPIPNIEPKVEQPTKLDSATLVIPPVIIEEGNRNTSQETSTGTQAGRITHEPLLIEKITLYFRFDYNRSELDDETEKFLMELSETLKSNPDYTVQLIGHTDNIGAEHHNQKLSVRRAQAVKNFLTNLGVEANRISVDGKGMTEPLNTNSTDEERALNRRVEIKLVSSK